MGHLSRLSKRLTASRDLNRARTLIRNGANKGVYKHRELWFWAERGIVHLVDNKDESYQAVNPYDFRLRAAAFNDAAKHAGKIQCYEEQKRLTKLVEDMAACFYKALEQGSPYDPKVLPKHEASPKRYEAGNPRKIAESQVPWAERLKAQVPKQSKPSILVP